MICGVRYKLKTDIFGVGFDALTYDEAMITGQSLCLDEGFHYVVTPNPEIVNMAMENESFRNVLNEADLVLPDGIGIVYAGKILNTPVKERVPGIEFAQGIMKFLAEEKLPLYLLGAKPTVAQRAGEFLKEQYPGLVICGTGDGYFKDNMQVVSDIKNANAKVVFVCLGAPKQEEWIATYGKQTGASLMIGLGGVLDVFAGDVKRAPILWQKLGFEWLYRLFSQPARFGRIMKLPLFLLKAIQCRLKGG